VIVIKQGLLLYFERPLEKIMTVLLSQNTLKNSWLQHRYHGVRSKYLAVFSWARLP